MEEIMTNGTTTTTIVEKEGEEQNQDSGNVLLMLNDFVYFDVDESSMTPLID